VHHGVGLPAREGVQQREAYRQNNNAAHDPALPLLTLRTNHYKSAFDDCIAVADKFQFSPGWPY
jgi:hypothetical protein